MKIAIKAHPKSKKTQVVEVSPAHYEVWVRSVPDKGKANQEVIEAMSKHLGIARSKLVLCSGLASRHKVIEVNND